VITISEVENRGKRSIGALVAGALFFFACTGFSFENPPTDGTSLEKLGDCNWPVTYRCCVYDLSPLTRETLSRPIENDIRYVLQRVPEANERLDSMNGHLRDAKAHTIIASLFITGLLVTKLLESRLTNDATRPDYRTVEAASGGFFLAATLFSWRSSVKAKEDLVGAVDAFNAHSPFKIEPAVGHSIEPAPGRAP